MNTMFLPWIIGGIAILGGLSDFSWPFLADYCNQVNSGKICDACMKPYCCGFLWCVNDLNKWKRIGSGSLLAGIITAIIWGGKKVGRIGRFLGAIGAVFGSLSFVEIGPCIALLIEGYFKCNMNYPGAFGAAWGGAAPIPRPDQPMFPT